MTASDFGRSSYGRIILHGAARREIENYLSQIEEELDGLEKRAGELADYYKRAVDEVIRALRHSVKLIREAFVLKEELSLRGLFFAYSTVLDIAPYADLYERVRRARMREYEKLELLERIVARLYAVRKLLEKLIYDILYEVESPECQCVIKTLRL